MLRFSVIARSALLAALALPGFAAQAESGIYIGGGVSQANIQDSPGNPAGTSFDESAVGARLFAGYHLDVLPIIKFAAEVGYRELGQASRSDSGVDTKYRVHGPDYALMAGVGLGPVDLFGRAGAMNYKLQKDIGGAKSDFDGTAPVYGVGAWFTLFGVGVRAEFERIDIKQLDRVQVISASMFYQF